MVGPMLCPVEPGLIVCYRAAAATFQRQGSNTDHGPDLAWSTVKSYTAVDRRDGLTSIGKRLLEGLYPLVAAVSCAS
jgi:hypothetical protein